MNSYNATGMGCWDIQGYLASLQRQNVLVKLQNITEFDENFQNENIAAGTRTTALPAFWILRHMDSDSAHEWKRQEKVDWGLHSTLPPVQCGALAVRP